MLYKVIKDGEVFDILNDPQFVRETRCGHIVGCGEHAAIGVILSDSETIVHIADKSEFTDEYPTVILTAIDREEFLDLAELLRREVQPQVEDVAIYKARLSETDEQISSVVDYNIMMGTLADPSEMEE